MSYTTAELDDHENAQLLAYADAARAAMAQLPPPAEYAYGLPLEVAEALTRCWAVPGDWRCRKEDRALLSSYGLADAREPFLSAYGMKVRKAVVEQRFLG